jgi:hypothetical protein
MDELRLLFLIVGSLLYTFAVLLPASRNKEYSDHDAGKGINSLVFYGYKLSKKQP